MFSRLFKWFSYSVLVIILLIVGGVMLAYFSNASKVKAWKAKPQPPGRMVKISNYKVYAQVEGKGPATVVLFPALGSTTFEWWNVRQALAPHFRVVSYDRGGYGWSEPGPAPRTSKRIVDAARSLLQKLKINPPYILVGHSLGGFYAQHFARLYPKTVKGVVLLDPVSDNRKWQQKLPRTLFKKFIDKSLFIKRGRTLAKFGLFRYLTVLPKALPSAQRKHIVEVFSNPASYKVFLDEYLTLYRISFPRLSQAPAFPNVPLTVVYHDSEVALQRMLKFETPRQQAELVERTWKALTREYLKLSPQSRWVIAHNSTHQIHIDQPETVVRVVRELVASAPKRRPVLPVIPSIRPTPSRAAPTTRPATQPAPSGRRK